MNTAGSGYRLDGIYKQRQEGFYMQRVKLAAGVISAAQARSVAAVSSRFGQSTIHLTSRGSIELHWLTEASLPHVKRELSMAGLTSRGACGGAVRGITCGSQGAQGFPVLEALARRLHRHFTGNPRFEQLPKKFKIGIEADTESGRHLIQDAGLVLSHLEAGRAWYSLWIAGGLGRDPQPGFLLSEAVAEDRVIPVIEAVLRVYATHAPPHKRLKFLAREFGEQSLRQLVEAEAVFNEELPAAGGLPDHLVATPAGHQRLLLPVFAGELTSGQLRIIAETADRYAEGVLIVTSGQDIEMLLTPGADARHVLNSLQQATGLGITGSSTALRVCPGSHECRMGLAATRETAQQLLEQMSDAGRTLSWAISGCPNSCSQPQLADIGIIAARLAADKDGHKTPRFDVYRRSGPGFGQKIRDNLSSTELITSLTHIADY